MASRAMVTTITLMVSSLTCCLGGQAAAPKPASRGSVPLRVFHHHRNTASSSRFARAFLSPLPSSSARRPFAAPSAGIDPVDNKEEQGLQEGRGLVKMVTGEDFERHLHDDDRVAVVTFGMRSCRACKGFQRKFEKLGAKYDPSAFKFLKLNMVDGEPSEEVFQRYDITHTPSFLIFHKGEVLDRYQGISETRLKRTIDAAVAHLSGLLAPSESLGESPMMTRPAVAPQQDVSPGFSWQSASTPEPSEASAAAAVAQVAQSRVDSHLRRALAKADAMASEALETLDTPVTEIRRKSTTTRVKVPSEASSEQVAAVQLKQQLVEKMQVHQDHGLREELEMMSDAVTQIRMRLVQSNRVEQVVGLKQELQDLKRTLQEFRASRTQRRTETPGGASETQESPGGISGIPAIARVDEYLNAPSKNRRQARNCLAGLFDSQELCVALARSNDDSHRDRADFFPSGRSGVAGVVSRPSQPRIPMYKYTPMRHRRSRNNGWHSSARMSTQARAIL